MLFVFSCAVVKQNRFEKEFLKALQLTSIPKEDTTYYIKDTRVDLFLSKNRPDRDIHVYKRNRGYTFLKFYSKQNYKYLGGGDMFYEVLYGKWRYYDENGNLKEERSYDEPYKFSVNQLIKKMKKEYHINLAVDDKDRDIDVYRGILRKIKPCYVVYYLSEERENFKRLLIDGTTGKTLVFQKLTIDSARYENPPSVHEIYFDSINKVKK